MQRSSFDTPILYNSFAEYLLDKRIQAKLKANLKLYLSGEDIHTIIGGMSRLFNDLATIEEACYEPLTKRLVDQFRYGLNKQIILFDKQAFDEWLDLILERALRDLFDNENKIIKKVYQALNHRCQLNKAKLKINDDKKFKELLLQSYFTMIGEYITPSLCEIADFSSEPDISEAPEKGFVPYFLRLMNEFIAKNLALCHDKEKRNDFIKSIKHKIKYRNAYEKVVEFLNNIKNGRHNFIHWKQVKEIELDKQFISVPDYLADLLLAMQSALDENISPTNPSWLIFLGTLEDMNNKEKKLINVNVATSFHSIFYQHSYEESRSGDAYMKTISWRKDIFESPSLKKTNNVQLCSLHDKTAFVTKGQAELLTMIKDAEACGDARSDVWSHVWESICNYELRGETPVKTPTSWFSMSRGSE